MKAYILNISILVCILLFFSCHTTIFHNVGKRLQGSWTRTPIPDTINPDLLPTWTFEDGKLFIDNRIYKGGGDPSSYFPDTIAYVVVNSMTRHLLFFEFDLFHEDYYNMLNNTPISAQTPEWMDSIKIIFAVRVVEKWQFIKISKTYLYLSKINASGADYITGSPDQGTNQAYDLNGGVQIGFIRK